MSSTGPVLSYPASMALLLMEKKCNVKRKMRRTDMRCGFSGCKYITVCVHQENAELGVGAGTDAGTDAGAGINSPEIRFIQGVTTPVDDCDEDDRSEWTFPKISWEDSDLDDNMSSSSLSSTSYSSTVRKTDDVAYYENDLGVASSSSLPQLVLVSPASNKQCLTAGDLQQSKNCMVRSTAVTCLRALFEISCTNTKGVGSTSVVRDNNRPFTYYRKEE